MRAFNQLPYPIKVSRFQHLSDAIQEFLLSDKKRGDLINLLKHQNLGEEYYIRLNDILWGLFLKEIDMQMLNEGISEHLSIDGQKAKEIGEILRRTILPPFLDFFPSATPKRQNNPPVIQGNVVNLKR